MVDFGFCFVFGDGGIFVALAGVGSCWFCWCWCSSSNARVSLSARCCQWKDGRESRAIKARGRWNDGLLLLLLWPGLVVGRKDVGSESRVAISEVWDCGRKMWTCRRAEAMIELSASVPGSVPGSVPASVFVVGSCSFSCSWWSCLLFFIAARSCCTNLETEKVLSVSMMVTQASLPPRDGGKIAFAVKR